MVSNRPVSMALAILTPMVMASLIPVAKRVGGRLTSPVMALH